MPSNSSYVYVTVDVRKVQWSDDKKDNHFLVCLQCFVEHNWFHLIGIICGLAIYNSTVVDLHFPLALYKKLLDVAPTLEDFMELSPTEAR